MTETESQSKVKELKENKTFFREEEAKNAREQKEKLKKDLMKLDALSNSFDFVRLGLASPEKIMKWATRTAPNGRLIGEVSRAETINFRTHKAEFGGLFCERIFGPTKDWRCYCGKFNGIVPEKICDVCLVELIEARVRRYRMGYITLACPIGHFWYSRGVPNYLTLILKVIPEYMTKKVATKEPIRISRYDVEEILYFFYEDKEGAPLDKEHPLYKYCFKNYQEFSETEEEEWFWQAFRSYDPYVRGAEIIKQALDSIDLSKTITAIRSKIIKLRSARPLRILENFLATNSKLSWMILTILPVLPPNLRPLVELENGKLVAADANEMYRVILYRNERLQYSLKKISIPVMIVSQSRRMLQEGVDSLIDNGRVSQSKVFTINDRPLKSLTETLEGKQGRFRQTLLGKRVDYSGRSVIIAGPHLRLNQCGLPYDMAVDLFRPHLINFLLKTKIKPPSYKIDLANLIIRKNKLFIWRLLEELMRKKVILLNRAPTLHKFGIQSFNPVLILGQAIQLHPLVCTGFNADFDGDQMAVHLPLSERSQLESSLLMRPSNNILSPCNGEVILKPSQDMVIGSYYLSLMIKDHKKNILRYFASEDHAIAAFYSKRLALHENIFIKYELSNEKVEVFNKEIKILQSITSLSDQKIQILKVLRFNQKLQKLYILTNIGIIIAYSNSRTSANYQLKDLYLETTVGRILFSTNIKSLFNILDL